MIACAWSLCENISRIFPRGICGIVPWAVGGTQNVSLNRKSNIYTHTHIDKGSDHNRGDTLAPTLASRKRASIGQCSSSIPPSAALSLTKKYCVFMCCVRLELENRLLVSRRRALLLSYLILLFSIVYPWVSMKYLDHSACKRMSSTPTSSSSMELIRWIFCMCKNWSRHLNQDTPLIRCDHSCVVQVGCVDPPRN